MAIRVAPSASSALKNRHDGAPGAPDDLERARLAGARGLEHPRRERAVIARLGGLRPLRHPQRIGIELGQQGARQPAHRLETVEGAQRRAHGVGADAGARSVVAEQEAAPADDSCDAGDAGDARRARAGDDQSAVARAIRADAGGHGVIGHLDSRPAGKRGGDARGVLSAGQARQTDAERHFAAARGAEPGLGDHRRDEFANDAEAGLEIHVNIGRRPCVLSEFATRRGAHPRPATGGAAVYADEELGCRHAPESVKNCCRPLDKRYAIH